jgi:hypothetical protein
MTDCCIAHGLALLVQVLGVLLVQHSLCLVLYG